MELMFSKQCSLLNMYTYRGGGGGIAITHLTIISSKIRGHVSSGTYTALFKDEYRGKNSLMFFWGICSFSQILHFSNLKTKTKQTRKSKDREFVLFLKQTCYLAEAGLELLKYLSQLPGYWKAKAGVSHPSLPSTLQLLNPKKSTFRCPPVRPTQSAAPTHIILHVSPAH